MYRPPLPSEGAMGEGYENQCAFLAVLYQYGFSRSAFITLGERGGTLRDCCLIHRQAMGGECGTHIHPVNKV